MCRFVAYLGKKPITLARIIDQPTHSLINQSRKARIGTYGLNADGFGIAWYDRNIDFVPGLFKSIQPAWNDQNLRHIGSKVQSNCFIGHVRASTIGNVETLNCHPFSIDHFSFVHNGSISNFDAIKRPLLRSLSDRSYFSIHGETDSEHFFGLFHHILHEKFKNFGLNEMAEAMVQTIETIKELQNKYGNGDYAQLNTLLTDGTQIIATRYGSNPGKDPHSLYYSVGDYILKHIGKGLMNDVHSKSPGAVLIASEPVNEVESEWTEVPPNQMLLVDPEFNITVKPI